MKKMFVQRLRELQGTLNVSEFARYIGIKQQVADRYLKGERTPNGENMFTICKKTGASADWLLGLTEKKSGYGLAAAAESGLYVKSGPCAECAKKDAVIADQAEAIKDLSAAMGAQKKMTYPKARSCSRSGIPA